MSENSSKPSGISFLSLLLLAFIVLKLCKVIDWSWWWVLAPLWIPPVIALLILVTDIIIENYYKKKTKPKQQARINEIKESFDNRISKWQQRLDQMKEAQNKTKNNE